MSFSAHTLTQHDAPLLGVNIDHVATLRNARGGGFPDPVHAALTLEQAGADIITFHLREDRRHIRDEDVQRLKAAVKLPLNFEAGASAEMLAIIEATAPEHVCLVPERRQEITTEGGLNVAAQMPWLTQACGRLAQVGSRVSLFVAPDLAQIDAAAAVGAACVELHTGALANAWWAEDGLSWQAEQSRLQAAVTHAQQLGLRVHAGHGLALGVSKPSAPAHGGALGAPAAASSGWAQSATAWTAALPGVSELHIGHALVGHALWVGLAQAVADFKREIIQARRAAA